MAKRFDSGRWGKVGLTALGLGLAFGIGAYNLSDQKAPLVLTPIGDSKTAASDQVLVHVIGAVKKPGLYSFAPGARVNDAIERAGGRTADGDLEAVNLAAVVEDGQQIVVPSKEEFEPVAVQPFAGLQGQIKEAPTRPRSSSGAKAPTRTSSAPVRSVAKSTTPAKKPATKKTDTLGVGSISINTATAAQLERLPGVGPATASNIIGYRREKGPFMRVDDLLGVRGIGPKKLQALRKYVRL